MHFVMFLWVYIPNIQLNKISNPHFEQFKNETFLVEPLDIYKL